MQIILHQKQRVMKIMTKYTRITRLLATLILAAAPTVQAASVLKTINRIDEPTRMQLFFRFSDLDFILLYMSDEKVNKYGRCFIFGYL